MFVGWGLLLAGCGCPEVSSLRIEDPYDRATPAQEETIWAAVEDFVAWTGESDICVDTIRVEEPSPHEWQGEYAEFGGRYSSLDQQIFISPDSILDDAYRRTVILHELTHAWDGKHGYPSRDWEGALSESPAWETYPWQREGSTSMLDEALAGVSGFFDPNPLAYLQERTCDASVLHDLLSSEVYPNAPTPTLSPVDLSWEPVFHGRGEVARWIEAGDASAPEAVLLWTHTDGTRRFLQQKNLSTGALTSVEVTDAYAPRTPWTALRSWQAEGSFWLHATPQGLRLFQVRPHQKAPQQLRLTPEIRALASAGIVIQGRLYLLDAYRTDNTAAIYAYDWEAQHLRELRVPDAVWAGVGQNLQLVVYKGRPALYSETGGHARWGVYDPIALQWYTVDGPTGGWVQSASQEAGGVYLQDTDEEEGTLFWEQEGEAWGLARGCVPTSGSLYKRVGDWLYRVDLRAQFVVERAALREE